MFVYSLTNIDRGVSLCFWPPNQCTLLVWLQEERRKREEHHGRCLFGAFDQSTTHLIPRPTCLVNENEEWLVNTKSILSSLYLYCQDSFIQMYSIVFSFSIQGHIVHLLNRSLVARVYSIPFHYISGSFFFSSQRDIEEATNTPTTTTTTTTNTITTPRRDLQWWTTSPFAINMLQTCVWWIEWLLCYEALFASLVALVLSWSIQKEREKANTQTHT